MIVRERGLRIPLVSSLFRIRLLVLSLSFSCCRIVNSQTRPLVLDSHEMGIASRLCYQGSRREDRSLLSLLEVTCRGWNFSTLLDHARLKVLKDFSKVI